MKPVRQTLTEMVLLTVAATTVALAGNALRSGPHLKLGQNYFDKGTARARAAAQRAREAKRASTTGAGSTSPSTTSSSTTATSAAEPTTTEPVVARGRAASAQADSAPEPSTAEKHLDHPYQEVTLDEVVAILDDPNTAMGVNLFVDARGDAAFAEGHIPGAIQLNHYELEKHLDDVLYRAQAAERIVVYCNGGNCEDSIFVCTDLLDAGIAYDNIYLYAGGWKEWSVKGSRVERGESPGDGD